MPQIRVLIVDDSVLVRQMVSKVLNQDPELNVVGIAANGRIAIAKIPQIHPEIVILDVEMPEMDGLETLVEIRKNYPNLPVIMFSSLTERGAIITLDALSLGARDYVTKPTNTGSKEAALEQIRDRLIPKIKVFCRPPVTRKITPVSQQSKILVKQPTKIIKTPPRQAKTQKVDILAIGVSTGGPNALATLLPQLPANFPVPIAIVQHMPPVFTKRLAERLNKICQIEVKEAVSGSILEPGTAWIAPGDFHIETERKGVFVQILNHQGPPENSCRPAADVLFRSVARTYAAGVLGLVLTGMGKDGLYGCECIREVGGQILVQDEASSVVWGMPGIVAHSGLADKVLPLDRVASEIMKRVINA